MQTVLHVVGDDEGEHETALAIAGNLLDGESGRIDDVAVVAQAGGIEVVSTDGDHADRVHELLNEGVSFAGCANTLETMDMSESDLVDGVETVPEGAVGVTSLQDEGYAYLRP